MFLLLFVIYVICLGNLLALYRYRNGKEVIYLLVYCNQNIVKSIDQD